MIPKRTVALTDYARAVKAGAPPEVVADARALYTAARLRELARGGHARFFIDGSIVRGPDSVTVVLRVHDASADSLLARAGATAGASESLLGQFSI